jgi:hypothetical protein
MNHPSYRGTRILTEQEHRARQIRLGTLKDLDPTAVGPALTRHQAEIAANEKDNVPVVPAKSKNLDSVNAIEKHKGSPDKFVMKKPPRRTNDDVDREEAIATVQRNRKLKSLLQNAEWYNTHQTLQQPLRPVHKYKTQKVSPDRILQDAERYNNAIQSINKILNPVLKYKKGTGKLMTMQQLRRRRLQRQKKYKTQSEDPPLEDYTDELDWTETDTTPEFRDSVNRMIPFMHNYMAKTATAIMFQHWKLGTTPAHDKQTKGYVTFTPAGADWFSNYNFEAHKEVQALARRIVMLNGLNTTATHQRTAVAYETWRHNTHMLNLRPATMDLWPSAATTQHNRVPTQISLDITPGQHTHKVIPQKAPQTNMKALRTPRTRAGHTTIKTQRTRSTDKGKQASRTTPPPPRSNALHIMILLALGARLLAGTDENDITTGRWRAHRHHEVSMDTRRHTLLRDWRKDLQVTGTLFLDTKAKTLSQASNWHMAHAQTWAQSNMIAGLNRPGEASMHPHAIQIYSENRVRKWPKRPQIGYPPRA